MKNKIYFFPYILILLVVIYSLFSNKEILNQINDEDIQKNKKDFFRFIIPDKKTDSDIKLFDISRDTEITIKNSNFVDFPIYLKDLYILSTNEKELFIPYFSTSEIIYYPINKKEKELIYNKKEVLLKRDRIYSVFFFEALKKEIIETKDNYNDYIYLNETDKNIHFSKKVNMEKKYKEYFFLPLKKTNEIIFGREFTFKSTEYKNDGKTEEEITLKIPKKTKLKKIIKWGKKIFTFKDFGIIFYVLEDFPVIVYKNPNDPLDKGVIAIYNNKVNGIGFNYDYELKRYSYLIFQN